MKQLKNYYKNIFLMIVIILLFSTLTSFALADLTDLTIQGKLTDDVGDILTGTYSINFTIYDSYSGGNSLWTQTSSVTTDARGIYSVILDNVDLDFNAPYYLGIKVGADSEMTPRFNLTSSPYSHSASGLNDTIVLDNNVSFDSGTLFIDTTNNYVGIGTETPTQVLEVAGNVNISGSNKLYAPEICIAGDCQTSWPSGGSNSGSGWTNTSTMTTTNLNASIAGNLTVNGTLELNSSGAGTGIYFHSSSAQNSNHEIYSDSSDNWIFSMAGIGSGKSLTIGDSQHGLYTHASYTKIRSSASADLDFEFGGAIKHMMNADGLSLGSSLDPLATLHIYTIGNLSQGIAFGDGDSGLYENTDDNIYMKFGNTNNTIRFYDSSAAILDLGHRSVQDAAVRLRADNSDNAYFEAQLGYGKAMYIGSTVSTQTRLEMSHAQIIFHTSTNDDFIWIDSNSDPNQFIVDYSKQYTGTSSLPTFGFGDLDTGLYENADDNLTLTVGGTALVNYNTTDLSILGSGKLRSPEICIAGDCQTSWPSSSGASSAGGWTNDSSWTNTSLNVNITGNLSVDTDTLFVDSTNNRVGIGTASPTAELEVNGKILAYEGTSNRKAYLGDDGLYISRTSDGNYSSTITADGTVTFNTRDHYIFNSNGVNTITFFSNGRVRIGSGTPQSILGLNGGTGSLSTGLTFGDGDTGFYESADDNLTLTVGGTNVLSVNTSDLEILGSGKLRSPEICIAGDCQTSWPSGADGYIGDVSSHTAGGSLDMNSNVISNIGDTGTDFSATGGLTLAGAFDPNGAITLPTSGISGAGSGSGLDADTIDGNNFLSTWNTSLINVQTATSSDFHNIGGVDADTIYSASGTLLDLTSETFSVNEGTLTNSYLCTYVTGTGIVCNSDPSTYLDNTDTNLSESDVEGYVYDNDNTLGAQWTVASAGTYDINFDTNTLVVDTGANRVGVGTATPLAKVHINGGTGSLATGLVFGNGDTGIYESSDDFLVMNATNVSVSDGTNAIVLTPKSINSTITTTGGSNLTISSSGGNVIIQLG